MNSQNSTLRKKLAVITWVHVLWEDDMETPAEGVGWLCGRLVNWDGVSIKPISLARSVRLIGDDVSQSFYDNQTGDGMRRWFNKVASAIENSPVRTAQSVQAQTKRPDPSICWRCTRGVN